MNILEKMKALNQEELDALPLNEKMEMLLGAMAEIDELMEKVPDSPDKELVKKLVEYQKEQFLELLFTLRSIGDDGHDYA